MADLASSNALIDPNKLTGSQPGAVQGQGQTIQVGGAGSGQIGAGGQGSAGQGASAAPAGAGGGGGWANIQSYLDANRGDTGTASYLQNKVGSQFDQEQKNLDQAGKDTVQQGVAEADKIKNDTANAGSMVDAASQAYQWSGQQSDPYTQNVNTLKGDLNNAYSGPSSFSYTMSQPTQRYGADLGNEQGYQGILNQSYRDRTSQPMNDGQLGLQRQLDTTNDALGQTRQNLLAQYAGLGTNINNAVTSNNAALSKAAEDYRVNQNAMRDYLNGTLTDTGTSIGNQEADAKLGINNAYDGSSGQSSIGWDNLNSIDRSGSFGNIAYQNAINKRTAAGTWNADNSFRNLAREEDIWAHRQDPSNIGKMPIYIDTGVGGSHGYDEVNADAANKQKALDSFWDAQQNKYGQTADADKRRWNSIQDILGNSDRKTQGYNVKGAV